MYNVNMKHLKTSCFTITGTRDVSMIHASHLKMIMVIPGAALKQTDFTTTLGNLKNAHKTAKLSIVQLDFTSYTMMRLVIRFKLNTMSIRT